MDALAPTISISLTLNPPNFTRTEESELSITATLQGIQPITIYTWATIFNLRLSLRRKNFVCNDLTAGTPVNLEITKGPKRPGFVSRERGGRDDAFFRTLEPGIPVSFAYKFLPAARRDDRHALLEGHRYSLGISPGEVVSNWWTGRREDIMSLPGQRLSKEPPSGPPIVLVQDQAIEFEVMREELGLTGKRDS